MKRNPSRTEKNEVLDKLLGEEIATRLAEEIKSNPSLSKEQALLSVQQQILKDRPECPPANGKCPINDIPEELLVYIFQTGVSDQRDEEEDADPEEPALLDEDDGNEEWEDTDEEEGEESDRVDDDGSDVDITYEEADAEGQRRRAKRLEDAYRDDEYPFHILVSHVCQRWRSISIDTHSFWNAIDVPRQLCLDKIKTYVKRSGELPLVIRIDCTKDDELLEELEEPDHPNHEALMKLVEGTGGEELRKTESWYWFLRIQDLENALRILEPVVFRWGELDFRASEYKFILWFMARLHDLPPAPLLEIFGVFHHDDHDEYDIGVFPGPDKTAYLPFGGRAPKLKRVAFWGAHIDRDKAAQAFLTGLEFLELSYLTNDVRPTYSTFKKLMQNSPDLKELTLTAAGPALPEGVLFDSDEGWGPEPLTISSVEAFALQFHGVAYASALVQHLDFPNLTELMLDFEEQDYTNLVDKLAKPVRHRDESILRHLTKLKIRGLPCNAAAAEVMLSQLNNLKSLTLKTIAGDERMIFQKLIRPAAYRRPPPDSSVEMLCDPAPSELLKPEDQLPKMFCPALEEVTTVYVDSNDLKDLVAKRKELGTPLKRIRMGRSDDFSYENLEWLKKNVDDFGFHVPSDSEDEVEEEWLTDDEDEDDEGDDSDGHSDEDDEDDDYDNDDGHPTEGSHPNAQRT
ncbi:hypothetical protein CPB83DRAFT_856071 [Crepidotus variabilis]|uniref:F-box domain-containing protein n=1 Tax=Crepidotus variabilis TaxID=179855 RepID=A0A9P6JPI1_9AGAR|nr:hypothetical protein CPB83DRAFT_856071 [Crepidotus variabilis]